ncbi:MAG: sulfotransferase domain-containing protein, partial [Bacteroidota bacterium]|nr:sulfotransferase domain-containing protein [Bacteroidota bacterium]
MNSNMVWLVSYPKSGNTWFRIFLSNYLQNSSIPVSLENIERTTISSNAVDFEEWIGLNPFELTPDEVDLYRPDYYRILSASADEPDAVQYKKTHDAYTLNRTGVPLFPEAISKGAVYFVRNPLDVCVSYANHSASNVNKTVNFILNEKACIAGKRNGQLRQILLSWKNHIRSWCEQTRIPIHVVRYEDMKQRPIESFGSIVRFLGLEFDEERLERAILYSDFNLLQQMEQEKGFNEKMQMCKSFFWKGVI